MAKKAELLEEAKKLKLDVSSKNTIAEIEAAIKAAGVEPSEPKETETKDTQAITKAGKRSAKATREAEEETARKARTSEEPKSKPAQKAPKSKLERRSKGYRKTAEKIEVGKQYALTEAIELAKSTSPTKFDASVELHVNLSVDPRQADQNIRDNVVLPAGTGKTLRIAALTEEPKDAQAAGADIAGGDDLIQAIDKGNLDFDILIATPSMMPKLGKYAKVLGPKGLMPNPKSGTVTTDVKKAIEEAKAGRVEYRVDAAGIVHLSIGKVSFASSGLKDNIMVVITSIRSNKPSSVKSNYIKSAYLASTMGPSISIDLTSLNED